MLTTNSSAFQNSVCFQGVLKFCSEDLLKPFYLSRCQCWAIEHEFLNKSMCNMMYNCMVLLYIYIFVACIKLPFFTRFLPRGFLHHDYSEGKSWPSGISVIHLQWTRGAAAWGGVGPLACFLVWGSEQHGCPWRLPIVQRCQPGWWQVSNQTKPSQIIVKVFFYFCNIVITAVLCTLYYIRAGKEYLTDWDTGLIGSSILLQDCLQVAFTQNGSFWMTESANCCKSH